MTEGEMIELDVETIAPGGHCVARDSGHVVFVRHSLPGERVRARITDRGKGYLRADAVEILRSSPDRVEAGCPWTGPAGCGGCDFQHVSAEAQRSLKAAVLREQLDRIAGMRTAPLAVEPLPSTPGAEGTTGWRTRVRYVADSRGRLGFRRHRGHEVVAVDRCGIASPDIQSLPLTSQVWEPGEEVNVVRDADGQIVTWRPKDHDIPRVRERATGRTFEIEADGFWQIHPAAADTLASAVVEALVPRPGERAWDLYGGAGLFASAMAAPIGPTGAVTVVESDPGSVRSARRCLSGCSQVRVVRATVSSALRNPRWRSVDLVVADPPRRGMGADAVRAIVARSPRAVALVSCDGATFARDVRSFADLGYHLDVVRAFDAFPMTHHVEIVGRLVARDQR